MFVSIVNWLAAENTPNVVYVILLAICLLLVGTVTLFFTRRDGKQEDRYNALALDTAVLSNEHADLIRRYHNARSVLDVVLRSHDTSDEDATILLPLLQDAVGELESNLLGVAEVHVCQSPLCIELIYDDGTIIELYPTMHPAEDEEVPDEDEAPTAQLANPDDAPVGSFAGVE